MYGLSDPDCPVDMQKLTASIQAHEGLRLQIYDDINGYATIGYGRNLSTKGISNDEATYLLGNDIRSAIGEAEAQPWWGVVKNDDVRSRALIEILFNVGLGSFNRFVKAVAALCAGDFPTAANQFRDSAWFKQVGSLPGQRGYVLCQMIETGCD